MSTNLEKFKERRTKMRALSIALLLIAEELGEGELARKDDIEFINSISKRLFKRSIAPVAFRYSKKPQGEGTDNNGHQG